MPLWALLAVKISSNRVIPDFFAGQRGRVVHLGSDDVVGVLFSDGISCIFRGNTDLELVSDNQFGPVSVRSNLIYAFALCSARRSGLPTLEI